MNERYLTIFVAVYNIEKYLDRLFDCIKKQTFEDYEVLIMDDGSTDNSLEICKKHAELDDRIRVISLEHHGLAATRMETYKNIRTEFAVCIDGDDWVEPNYLKHLVDAQKKYSADLVISNAILCNEKGEEKYRFVHREEEFFNKKDYLDILPKLYVEDRLNYMFGRLYKSKWLKEIDVGEDDMGEDTRTVAQYLMKIKNMVVIDEYDYHYIKYSSRAITASLGNKRFYTMWKLNKFVYDLMEQNGLLNDEMIKAIDTRIFSAWKMALDDIVYKKQSKKEKYIAAEKIIGSEEYKISYYRQKEKGNIRNLGFKPIMPGKSSKYIKHELSRLKINSYKHRMKQILIKIFRK